MSSWRDEEARKRGHVRAANEHIAATERAFGPRRSRAMSGSFVCECSDPKCIAVVELSLALYEEIRADPHRYLIARDHEDPEAETVVAGDSAYSIVASLAGVGSRIAEETDPRRQARYASALDEKRCRTT